MMSDISGGSPSSKNLPSFVSLDRETLKKVRFILTDVDDTLTWDSTLPPATYEALSRLMAAGYVVIPVTGGCAGWSDLMARLWPVSGVITEGGACFLRKQNDGKLTYQYWSSANEMKANKERLLAQVETLLPDFTPLTLAQDQPYRLTDVAVDYAQDISPAAVKEKDAFLTKLAKIGLQAKASSIHINIWHGDYNKCAMAERVLKQEYGLSEQDIREQTLYVGDAPNDESMFAKFPLSVGVANIQRHLDVMTHLPSSITTKPGGYGFIEIVNNLLKTEEAS